MIILKKRNNIYDFMAYITLFDLIFGGSGNVFMLGNLSFRMILLLCCIGCIVVYIYNTMLIFDKYLKNTLFFLVTLILFFVYGVCFNDIRNSITELMGYFWLLFSIFFIIYFKNNSNKINEFICYFNRFTFILAILTLLLWLYCFIHGISVYGTVSILLSKYDYGMISYIGTIPRIFLKSSIFLCIGYFFALQRFFYESKKVKSLFQIFIYVLAIITTFTSGFIGFTFIFTIIYILKECYKRRNTSRIIIILVLSVIALFIIWKLGVVKIMFERYQESNSFEIKFIQAFNLISEWINKPLIGEGLGKVITIDYKVFIRTEQYRFENSWLELLFHTGIIGVSSFIYLIYTCLKNMKRKYILTQNEDYYILRISIIFVCLVSLTNPFMNNSIGLIFFSICMGIASSKALCGRSKK